MTNLLRHQRSRTLKSLTFALAVVGTGMTASPTLAAIDFLQTIVDETTATGGANSIAGVGYNAIENSVYVATFGAGGSLRKITDIDGSDAATQIASEGQIQLYYRDGDVTRGVLSPLQNGISLNPKPIGAVGAYQFAIIADAGRTTFPEGHATPTAIDPDATKRFYSYNLGTIPSGGDGRDIFTTRATLAQMQTAASGTTNTSTNQGRTIAWSGDGQSAYFVDSSTNFGGVWKLGPVNGGVERLAAIDVIAEPAVISSGGVDSIYFNGVSGTTNVGLDKITYDGVTVGPRTSVVSAQQFRDFFEAAPTFNASVTGVAADEGGNLYMTISTTPFRALVKLDAEGRLSKVASHNERDLHFTGTIGAGESPNASTLRMNPRAYNHPTAGPITQILYAEQTPLNFVAGANVFEVGDFNRDGDVTAPDMALFGPAIKTRGTALVGVDNYKFDLNGNSVVDWKDVKILQQHTGIATGDVNLDFTLGLADLDVLGANYYTTVSPLNKTWTTGDLGSIDPLYATTAADVNKVDAVDVNLFADAWFDFAQPIVKTDLTSRGYTGQFLDDVLDAFGFGSIAGDFDGDGDVDGADFLDWQVQLGTTVPAGTGADSDGDGLVEGSDLDPWKINFGQTAAVSATAAIPEPAAASLASLAIAALAVSRRRSVVHC